MWRDVRHWSPERRQSARVALTTARSLAQAPDGIALDLRQVSEGGLLLEGDAPMLPGSECALTLEIDGCAPLPVRARVVYSRASTTLDADRRVRYLTALAFVDLDAHQQEAVQAMVDSLPAADATGSPE